MTRLLLLCALLTALAVPVLAADAAKPATPAPLRGVVTLTQCAGGFDINLGTYDQLPHGASLQVLRNGSVIARARITSIDMLDAHAVLVPENRAVLVVPGDVVLVQSNTPASAQAAQERDARNGGEFIAALGIIAAVLLAAK